MGHSIETDAGKFVIYMGSEADEPSGHRPLEWYYAPENWRGGPYSRGYYSPEAAEEACWEHSGEKETSG